MSYLLKALLSGLMAKLLHGPPTSTPDHTFEHLYWATLADIPVLWLKSLECAHMPPSQPPARAVIHRVASGTLHCLASAHFLSYANNPADPILTPPAYTASHIGLLQPQVDDTKHLNPHMQGCTGDTS